MWFKRILTLSLLGLCLAGNLYAQKSQQLWEENFKKYIRYADRNNTEEKIASISSAAYYAKKSVWLDDNMKMITWYCYMYEALQANLNHSKFSDYVYMLTYNAGNLDKTPTSYAHELMAAYGNIYFSMKSKPKFKVEYLIRAKMILERLATSGLPASAENDYKKYYDLANLEVSDKERVAMLAHVNSSLESCNAIDFLEAAKHISKNAESASRGAIALKAAHMSAEKGNVDAWAQLGYMYEYGAGVQKDMNTATLNYLTAAEKGSLWGELRYAGLLIEGKNISQDYSKALSILNSNSSKGDFHTYGGGYYLASIYENGWGVHHDYVKAVELYTQSYNRCIFQNLKNYSYKGSARCENKIAEEYIDMEIATLDIYSLDDKQLAGFAERYANIGAKDKALKYTELAISNGSAFCAFRLAMHYFEKSDRKDFGLMKKSFDNFKIAADGNYAPAKYNLSIAYLYGYGVTPDHDLALNYYQKYYEQISSEGYYEYGIDDYLSIITGTRYKNDDIMNGSILLMTIEEFKSPELLYTWATYRERDSAPEVVIYFYKRAAQFGHEKAQERLENFLKRINDSREL